MLMLCIGGCGAVPDEQMGTTNVSTTECEPETAESGTEESATAESAAEESVAEELAAKESITEESTIGEMTTEAESTVFPETVPELETETMIKPPMDVPTEVLTEGPTEEPTEGPTEVLTEEPTEVPPTAPTVLQPTPQPAPSDSYIGDRLNSLSLNPVKTGCKELDRLVESILAEIIGPKMTTYEKAKACYNYLIEHCAYGSVWCPIEFETTDEIQEEAYVILTTGVGVCDHYSAAYAVMMRAIGLDVRTESGWTALANQAGYTGHTWTVLEIDGVKYIFDPQVEDDIAKGGAIGDYRFGKTVQELPWKYVTEWTEDAYRERAMRCDPDKVIEEMMARMIAAGREELTNTERATFHVTVNFQSRATAADILSYLWTIFEDRGAMEGHYVNIRWNGVNAERGTHSFTMYSAQSME